ALPVRGQGAVGDRQFRSAGGRIGDHRAGLGHRVRRQPVRAGRRGAGRGRGGAAAALHGQRDQRRTRGGLRRVRPPRRGPAVRSTVAAPIRGAVAGPDAVRPRGGAVRGCFHRPWICETAMMTIVLIAIACYLLAALLLVRSVMHGDRRISRAWLLPALPAVALHAGFHLLAWRSAGGADLHFFSALSLVGLGMALLTLLVGARAR